MRCSNAIAALLWLAAATFADGINTNSALPVGEGTLVSRTQARRADLDSEVDRYLASQTFAYGASGRLTYFASLGYVWNRPGPDGLTDLALFGRYRFFARDAKRQTLSFSAILGAELPTGQGFIGGDSAGAILGLVGTWAKRDWTIDTDFVRSFRFDDADSTRANLAVSYAVHATKKLQLVGVLEANYRRDGSEDVLFVSPGLQLQLRGVILEASFQVRALEDAARPTARHVVVLGVRFVF
ncbi:MAG: hypothetical protein V3T86_08325 [Planctomycetota bacterium]